MNFFDVLFAEKLGGGSPDVPQIYTLFQPDISSYTSGSEVSNLGVVAAPITATNIAVSNNHFRMTAGSKLKIPCNPIAYKKCSVSFKISNFTSPNGNWSNFFGFIGMSSSGTEKIFGLRSIKDWNACSFSQSVTLYQLEEVLDTNYEYISAESEIGTGKIVLNPTVFPRTGFTEEHEFKMSFDSTTRKFIISIDDLPCARCGLVDPIIENNVPYALVVGDWTNENTGCNFDIRDIQIITET